MMFSMSLDVQVPLDRQKQGRQRGYPRVSSDTPNFAAFTPVVPGVRFNAAIF
jgi:hypothetical protein